jgi:hypothetical protein
MNAPKTIPIIPAIEPPLGRWSARAEFFDVFVAPALLEVLLGALVVVALAACGEDQGRY